MSSLVVVQHSDIVPLHRAFNGALNPSALRTNVQNINIIQFPAIASTKCDNEWTALNDTAIPKGLFQVKMISLFPNDRFIRFSILQFADIKGNSTFIGVEIESSKFIKFRIIRLFGDWDYY